MGATKLGRLKNIRTSCLGCPHLRRSDAREYPGKPVCTYTGKEVELEWEDLHRRDIYCGHGVTIYSRKRWRMREVEFVDRLFKAHPTDWAIRASAALLRSPRQIVRHHSRIYGTRSKQSRKYPPEAQKEFLKAARRFWRAKDHLKEIADQYGVSIRTITILASLRDLGNQAVNRKVDACNSRREARAMKLAAEGRHGSK